MDYTARYNGTFCTTKPIKRKRTLTPHQKAMMEFNHTHAERLPNGKVIIRVTEDKNSVEE